MNELPGLISWPSLAFVGFVALMLLLDFSVFHRGSREMRLREAAGWTMFWFTLAMIFNAWIWYQWGPSYALQFFTGYLVEWSLSMDNVFVFAVIFSFFSVPKKYQYRVLFWGILGAVVMRLLFIYLGAALLREFSWMALVFGGFLLYVAIKLALLGEAEPEPDKNLLMRLGRRVFRVAHGDHGEAFFVMEDGRRKVTRLFLVLLVVESTDVMFAVDSVPAIFGITNEEFLIFTSNVFAILGLRALYFLLAGVMDLFRYMSYGLAAVLGFVGLKMLAEYGVDHHPSFRAWFEGALWTLHEGEPVVSHAMSLTIIVSLLAVSILASLWASFREGRRHVQLRPPAKDPEAEETDAKAPSPEGTSEGAED